MAWATNGNMTKKLLHKTLRVYLIFSVLILIVAAPLFYYITEKLYINDADEALQLRKHEFLIYSLPQLKQADIATWNRFNRDIKIEPDRQLTKDTIFYSNYYDTLDFEHEPYREINVPVTIQGKPYTYMARINLVEADDLMKSIALLFLVIIILLLSGLFIITKRLSINLWKPFYDTLHQIEQFEIDKFNQPELAASNIEEFNRLNQSIEQLVKKNISIYHNQKEFIENAAHELQTPLAVFKAKIDMLMQLPDVTQTQFEILNSLNETVGRLTRLNKNLLLLSKIENDNYSNKELVSLNEILEKNRVFFEEQAKAKNIRLNMVLSNVAELKANLVLLEILISNLLLNAVKHNTANGQINVSINKQTLVVASTGVNKPLEADKLFNRFSKSNPSEQGNGLGLAIVKKIADINNWQVEYAFENKFHLFSIRF